MSRALLVCLAVAVLAAMFILGLGLEGGHRAAATQDSGYTGHLSIGSCDAVCAVDVGTTFAVDVNLDTWIDPYDGFSFFVLSGGGNCVSANTDAVASTWPGRTEQSGCPYPGAAAVKGANDSSSTGKGKIAEVLFNCTHAGVVQLAGAFSYVINGVTGRNDPVSMPFIYVECVGQAYTGHLSIGSCTEVCTASADSPFTVDVFLDTSPSPYDGFRIWAAGNCVTANTDAMQTDWPGRFELSGCVSTALAQVSAIRGQPGPNGNFDNAAARKGKIGEIVFICSQSGTIVFVAGDLRRPLSYVINDLTGSFDPITMPDLEVTCSATFTATPTSTPTITATPTPTPPPSVGGVSLDPGALPPREAAGRRIELLLAVAAAGALTMGGAAWLARRRRRT